MTCTCGCRLFSCAEACDNTYCVKLRMECMHACMPDEHADIVQVLIAEYTSSSNV